MTSARWAYFDTSVLVKRYVKEEASAVARRLLQRYRFLSSAIAPVEVRDGLAEHILEERILRLAA